jgi:hypothetical protein
MATTVELLRDYGVEMRANGQKRSRDKVKGKRSSVQYSSMSAKEPRLCEKSDFATSKGKDSHKMSGIAYLLELFLHQAAIPEYRSDHRVPQVSFHTASAGKVATPAPPWHGSSRALFVYGGAERGISLARGFFTGEATWKPPLILEANI